MEHTRFVGLDILKERISIAVAESGRSRRATAKSMVPLVESPRLPLTSPDAWSHLAHHAKSLAHLDCQMIALAFLAGFVALLESPGPPAR
jgi:hypothetical protein